MPKFCDILSNTSGNLIKCGFYGLFLFNWAILGCQGSNDEGTNSSNPQVKITPLNLKSVLKNMELSCSDDTFCPEYVGLVAVNQNRKQNTVEREQVQFCTGFVIQDGRIATSSSCIKQHDKMMLQKDCSDNLAIRFLDTKFKKRHRIYSCKNVVSYSNKDLDQNYFIFEVENLPILPPDLSLQGLEDGENVRVPVFQLRGLSASLGKSTQASMEGLQCVIALNTLLHLPSTSSWSQTALAMNCEARQANWGAPVLNGFGKVVGIVQNHNLPKFNDDVVSNLKKFNVAESMNLVSSVMFTSLSCLENLVDYSGYNSNLNKGNCELYGKQLLTDLLISEAGWPEKSKAEVIEEWKSELPVVFEYKVEEKEKSLIEAKVICVKTEAQLGEENFKKFVKKEGWGWNRHSKIELSLSSQLTLGPKYFVDDLLRVKSEWKIVEKHRSINKVEIIEEKGLWTGNFQTWIIDGEGGKTAKPIKLPFCS